MCRTDLHVVDGDLPNPKLPIVPGHEIVGIVDAVGDRLDAPPLGTRVGIPWLGHTCGHCPYCLSARENLCDAPLFTGYTRDGGFATHVVADTAYAFPLDGFDDPVAAAPLMCAGLIGWRSLGMAGDGHRIGLYGLARCPHSGAGLPLAGPRGLRLTRRATRGLRGALSLGAVGPAALKRATGGARRRNHLRSRRRPRSVRVRGGAKGRTHRLRRHPHERHSAISLQPPVGRTPTRVGCKPNPAGWDRIPRCCITGRRDDNDDRLPA